jgi:exodeoxyribonuclease VII large subunit
VVGLARGLPDPQSLVGHASQRLDNLVERLPHSLRARLERAALGLAECSARLGSPVRLLTEAEGRLRPCAEQLRYLFAALLRERGGELRRLGARLSVEELGRRLPRHERLVGDLAARQQHAVERRLHDAGERLRACGSLLEGLSYQGVLARGFALVRDEDGRPVDSAARAREHIALELEFHDGRVRTLRSSGRGPGRQQPADGEQKRLL